MPSRDEVFSEITNEINNANNAQDHIRRKYLKELSQYTKRDTIILSSAFTSAKKFSNLPDNLLSISLEDIQGFIAAFKGLQNKNLDLILHSPGGSSESAQQIVNYIRSKYTHVRVIIPQNAMSAATMIACSADQIIMGKHSAIGPIDPQMIVPTMEGHFATPAQAILDEFEQAKLEISADPNTAAIWANRINIYPIGFLKICDNVINRSKEVVELWLKTWMLKDCSDKNQKAHDIAEWLGNANIHRSHGRPINSKEAREQGLKIMNLEDDHVLQDKVLTLFHATMATHELTNCVKFIENQNGKGFFITMNS